MNNQRLPTAHQAKLPNVELREDRSKKKVTGDKMKWLYGPNLKEEIFHGSGSRIECKKLERLNE